MSNTRKQILLFGAGKSATVLIQYLLEKSGPFNWQLTVADADLPLAQSKINGHPNGHAQSFDINQAEERKHAIGLADIVISMLPPALHHLVALDCLALEKNLLTASYLDASMKKLEREIERKGLLFLCEMGLDPGIDHMSAMQLIEDIKNQGAVIQSFKSHCGGLIAPESDNNPWHYKITWNPANVVSAGKTGAVYKAAGSIQNKTYAEIFDHCDKVPIAGMGAYAWYPNRDSRAYAGLYGLEEADTFIRTTLRHPDFCKGWQYIVAAGLTDSENALQETVPGASIAGWFQHHLQTRYQARSFDQYLDQTVSRNDREMIEKQFTYLGLTGAGALPSRAVSSADVLQHLLESNLKMETTDKDMIIMLHEIGFLKNNQSYSTKSCMIVKGDDALNTAMAKTVGLPLGIATELILEQKITLTGLKIPILKEIYEPVLVKLKEKEIKFNEL